MFDSLQVLCSVAAHVKGSVPPLFITVQQLFLLLEGKQVKNSLAAGD